MIPETLPKDRQEQAIENEAEGLLEEVQEAVVAPIKPMGLVLPHKDAAGRWHWRLFFVTLSMLSTTAGVSFADNISFTVLTLRPSSSRLPRYFS